MEFIYFTVFYCIVINWVKPRANILILIKSLCCLSNEMSSTAGVATLSPSVLSRPMQRKLVTLVNCQLVEEEGRVRAVRAGRSLGERTVTELILQHQNPQQLSANLWAAVRARGCQFLGPGECPWLTVRHQWYKHLSRSMRPNNKDDLLEIWI